MSFDLGKFLHAVGSQINPFDGGQDFNSVYNPKKKKQVQQPTQTFRPQAGASPVMQSDAREVQRQRAKEHMAQIDANIRKTRSEIMSPLSVLSDVGKATGQVAGAIGKGVSDFATGTAQEYNKRANDVGSAAATVIREATGQNQAYDQHMRDLASNANQTDINLMKRLKVETDPARRAALNRALHINAGGTANRFLQDMQKQNLAATDPRKTLVNAANSALDVVTLGKGKAIMDGIKAGERLTMPVARQLAKNTLTTGYQGAGIGAAYGGVNTAADPNASINDYARNMGQGAAMGAAVGIGAQVALPVAGVAANKAIRTTGTAAKYVANASVEVPRVVVRKQAAQHPSVLGYDPQYRTLQQAFDTTPDPVARRGYAKAMAENRAARLATQRRIENKMLQGGYLGGPQALGFNDAKKAGQVFDGVDGKPRFEVDDSGAKIKNLNGKTLGEVLDHPKLFEQYPELRSMGVDIKDMPSMTSGSFDGTTIHLNKNRSINDQLKTLIHETQHSIQDKEGFASGGNLKMRDEALREATVEKNKLDNHPVVKKWMETQNAILLDKTKTMTQKKAAFDKNRVEFEKVPEFNAWLDASQKASRLEGDVGAEQYYKKLAGEAESRAVEARMNMPMSERYVKPEGRTLYHGSPVADVIKKEGFKVGKGNALFGEGVYLTPNKNKAGSYSIPKDYDYSKPVTEKMRNNGIVEAKIPKDAKIFTPADRAELKTADTNYGDPKLVTEKFKKLGYDGIELNGEVVIFDPSKISIADKPRSTLYDSLDVPKKDLIIRKGDGTAMSISKRISESKAKAQSAPVKTTGASDNKINTLEQKPQETQAQLKDTSNTEVQAGKIQNPSPYKGDYTTKAAENKPEDPLAIVDELFPSNKPVPKQRLTKAERQEVDAIIHEQDPNLLYRTSNFDKQKLTESSDNKLPRIHVNDLKRYFGNTENIPAKYKRTTGREDLDLLAQRAGYDDVDKFMQDFSGELDSRAQLRADTELLKEFRNDPETIKLARERIAARKAAEPKQIKVKGSQPTKNVPVTQVRRTGDVVTTSNVNPNLKSLSEKRYSVADDGELMPDKKGATSVFTDKDGRVKNIRIGDKVYGKEDFGDLSDVNGYGSTLATMRRNVERGFGKQTGEKLGRFLVDHQQDQATKMVERKLIENQGMKELAQDLGINFKTGSKNAKKVSAAIQDFGEGVRDKASLVDEFGQEQANKIVAADKWFRKQYDTLLNEANKTLTQYGYDPIPKRKNYYTHFQDESVWKKFGLRMDDVRRTLGDPTLQDAMPDAPRGKIDNKLAGQSEFTQPGKRFNRFALQRKGNQHTADAFQAFERYLEPTLNNIYMTPSISRARVISRAVAQDANVMGKDANGLLIQMKEWANDLAGKSNRFDRPLVDSNWGSKAIKTSQWLQKKAGQNTIVGNLSTAVMQPIVLAQTAGKFGYKNTALGLMRAAGKDSVEMTQSKFLKRRYSNLRSVTETKMDSARHAANVPLEVIEETATKSTWEAAYLDAKDKGLAGKEAIRYADVETEKTVAGRSIGEKPEIFRSKAAGFMTQYQLEVSNYWQQLGKEMSKKQALKVFVAAYGINSLLQATTGRRVGFDPISATIDMYGEIGKDEKSPEEKLKTAGQRALGEVADNLPFVPMIASTVMGQKNYQKLLGPDSQGGRFGVSSPISTVVNNKAYLVAPFGGAQVKKTTQGAQVLLNGKMTNKDGETVVDVPQTPANIARGLLFGPSAIPEVNQYYNNLSKKKVDQKPVDNQIGSIAGTQSLKGFTLTQQKDLQSISGPARDTVAAKFLAENKARRAEDAKKKTMTPEQKKSYSSDKRIDGYIADNVSKDTTSTLTKYYTMKPKDREAWFAKESDAEYKYEKAKYENDKANGSISKIEDIKRTRELKQSEIGSKYSKDARELYRLNKAQIYDYVTKSKDGKKLAEQLLAYDQALYNAGLSKYLKFKTGLAPSARGGGRGGKGRKSAGFKLPTTSVSNKAAKETLAELSRLLAGTTAKNQIPKQIGRKVALKKITVKG